MVKITIKRQEKDQLEYKLCSYKNNKGAIKEW